MQEAAPADCHQDGECPPPKGLLQAYCKAYCTSTSLQSRLSRPHRPFDFLNIHNR